MVQVGRSLLQVSQEIQKDLLRGAAKRLASPAADPSGTETEVSLLSSSNSCQDFRRLQCFIIAVEACGR